MSKVLTLSKCFKSSAVFGPTFCFADAEHLILLWLIAVSCYEHFNEPNSNKTIIVIHRCWDDYFTETNNHKRFIKLKLLNY